VVCSSLSIQPCWQAQYLLRIWKKHPPRWHVPLILTAHVALPLVCATDHLHAVHRQHLL
jgi:hypothetical protein